jgi:hypothetical protein
MRVTDAVLGSVASDLKLPLERLNVCHNSQLS